MMSKSQLNRDEALAAASVVVSGFCFTRRIEALPNNQAHSRELHDAKSVV